MTQFQVDRMHAPRSKKDVAEILSSFSILRGITIATLLVDGETGRFEAWGGSAPASTEPLFSWNIFTFFNDDSGRMNATSDE